MSVLPLRVSLNEYELKTCAINTGLTFVASCFFFSPFVATVNAIATGIFYVLNPNRQPYSWLPFNELHDFTYSFSTIVPPLLAINLVLGIAFTVLGIKPFQAPVLWLLNSGTWVETIYKIIRVCILAPVLEEILFRGALQGTIQNIQGAIRHITGNMNRDLDLTVRVAAQAIAFGLAHMHTAHRKIQNVCIFVVTSMLGHVFGYLRDDSFNLWSSIGAHFCVNSIATARLLVFGH